MLYLKVSELNNYTYIKDANIWYFYAFWTFQAYQYFFFAVNGNRHTVKKFNKKRFQLTSEDILLTVQQV